MFSKADLVATEVVEREVSDAVVVSEGTGKRGHVGSMAPGCLVVGSTRTPEVRNHEWIGVLVEAGLGSSDSGSCSRGPRRLTVLVPQISACHPVDGAVHPQIHQPVLGADPRCLPPQRDQVGPTFFGPHRRRAIGTQQ